MTIKARDLRNAFTTTAPLETLVGGRLARAQRILGCHRQADSLLGNWRNVVLSTGLHGSAAFQVKSVDPVSAAQEYPLRSVSRTIARSPAFNLLPGHFLMLTALVCPSGMTSKADGFGAYMADIAYGRIDVLINWGGPASVSTTESVILQTSGETWAAEATDAGAAWAGLRRVEVPLMVPAAVLQNPTTLRTWSESVTAEVIVKYRGGVRAVDVVVQQIPVAYARDVDADTRFSSTLVTDAAGKLVKSYPVDFPIEERTATDGCYGSLRLADVCARQHTAIGPVLASWTAFSDKTTAVTETEVPSVTTTSTAFVDMLRGGGGWKAGNPGMTLSAGSMSQQFKSSNGLRETRGKNACIPVRCWAYCSRSVGGNATLRFQTEAYSVGEIVFSSATAAWRSCTGHLRAGAHPQDPSVLQVFGRAAGGSTLSLSQVFVEYLDV